MLVLNRKVRERIRIADDIVIEIVQIAGSKVRVGIVAPKEISVHREEIYEQRRKEDKK